MKKTVIGNYEIQTESLILGAVTACGFGLIAMGIIKFFEASKIKKLQEMPLDEELEFEEYKANKARKLRRKKAAKIRGGISNTCLGAILAAIGICGFTPLKSYVVDDDFALKIEKAKKIEDALSSVNDTVKDIRSGLKNFYEQNFF